MNMSKKLDILQDARKDYILLYKLVQCVHNSFQDINLDKKQNIYELNSLQWQQNN